MSRPAKGAPSASIVMQMQTVREIKLAAEILGAERVKIDIDGKGDVAAVWWHAGDDVQWSRLRGPWTKPRD